MKTSKRIGGYLLFSMYILMHGCSSPTSEISPNLTLIQGDINGAIIKSGRNRLVVYGDPANVLSEADMVLFTHARRDVLWTGSSLVMNWAKAIVPSDESGLFTRIDSSSNLLTVLIKYTSVQNSPPKVVLLPPDVFWISLWQSNSSLSQ